MNYKFEYKKYLISSVLDTANNKIASSSFIVAFAVYLGLSNFAIGVYTVLDTITNMIQIFAAPIFSKIGQSKFIVLTNYTIYRLSSVCFALIPFLSNDINTRTFIFFIFASIYAVTGELGYITFVNWRMTLLKKEDRTKFTATRNIYKNTLVIGFSLFMGVILDKFTANGSQLYGFTILFTIIFLIAFIDIFIRINTYKPPIEEKKINLKESIYKPFTDKSFRNIIIIGGLNTFASGIGLMYLNVFLLRYLQINYVYYSILNILINLSEALFSNFWEKKSQNRNWHKVLIPMCLVYILVFSLLFFLNSKILIYFLPLIYILIGFGNSAYEMFDNVAIYEHSKEEYTTSYVTFERFIDGLVTALLPVISYSFSFENVNTIKITFSLSIITYLIFFIYIKTNCNQFKK
jgi:MFS family permease